MTIKKFSETSSVLTVNKFSKGKKLNVLLTLHMDKLVSKILEGMDDDKFKELESIEMELLEFENKNEKIKIEKNGKLYTMSIVTLQSNTISVLILSSKVIKKTGTISLYAMPDAGAKTVKQLKNMNVNRDDAEVSANMDVKSAVKHDVKGSPMFDKTNQKTQIKDDDEHDGFIVNKNALKVLKKYQRMNTKSIEGTADASAWSSKQFHEYMQKKFTKTYNQDSLEFNVIGNNFYSKKASGILWTNIKRKLIDVFENSGMTKSDLKEYIDWMFDVKSVHVKFPITLNFLSSRGVMTEWMVKNKKKKSSHNNIKGSSSIKFVDVHKK